MIVENYIKEKLSQLNLTMSSDLIGVELRKLGLDAQHSVSKSNYVLLDRFFYNVLPFFLNRATSVSEGQYSVSYSVDALTAYYRYLANKLGLPDELSNSATIREITPW